MLTKPSVVSSTTTAMAKCTSYLPNIRLEPCLYVRELHQPRKPSSQQRDSEGSQKIGNKKDIWKEDARLNMEDPDNECVVGLDSLTHHFIAYDSITCSHTQFKKRGTLRTKFYSNQILEYTMDDAK